MYVTSCRLASNIRLVLFCCSLASFTVQRIKKEEFYTVQLKTKLYCILFYKFVNIQDHGLLTKFFFQNLSLGCFLKIFYKFCKFWPRLFLFLKECMLVSLESDVNTLFDVSPQIAGPNSALCRARPERLSTTKNLLNRSRGIVELVLAFS